MWHQSSKNTFLLELMVVTFSALLFAHDMACQQKKRSHNKSYKKAAFKNKKKNIVSSPSTYFLNLLDLRWRKLWQFKKKKIRKKQNLRIFVAWGKKHFWAWHFKKNLLKHLLSKITLTHGRVLNVYSYLRLEMS